MAIVGRLAGALIAHTGDHFFLVGNPKVPCVFEQVGFLDPGPIDAMKCFFLELHALGVVEIETPRITLTIEGSPLLSLLAKRFLIERNGSVSDRLWNLVIESAAEGDNPADVQWLGEIPDRVWNIVRDEVLRCR